MARFLYFCIGEPQRAWGYGCVLLSYLKIFVRLEEKIHGKWVGGERDLFRLRV
jgi:hypothetical protein